MVQGLCTEQGASSSAEHGHTQHTRKGPGAVAASAPIPSLLRHRQGHWKDGKHFRKAADGSPGGQCQSPSVVLYLIVFWGFGSAGPRCRLPPSSVTPLLRVEGESKQKQPLHTGCWHEHRWLLSMWLCPESQVLIFLEQSLSHSIQVQLMASHAELQCHRGATFLVCSASSLLAFILQRVLPVPTCLYILGRAPVPLLVACVGASVVVDELCPWQHTVFRGDEYLIE